MKKVSLTDDELDLLIIGLHCVNRSNCNNYGDITILMIKCRK